jgi:hypothetical protein
VCVTRSEMHSIHVTVCNEDVCKILVYNSTALRCDSVFKIRSLGAGPELCPGFVKDAALVFQLTESVYICICALVVNDKHDTAWFGGAVRVIGTVACFSRYVTRRLRVTAAVTRQGRRVMPSNLKCTCERAVRERAQGCRLK